MRHEVIVLTKASVECSRIENPESRCISLSYLVISAHAVGTMNVRPREVIVKLLQRRRCLHPLNMIVVYSIYVQCMAQYIAPERC
jgi:hypothetical protein